jgi:hypothetical protein
VPVTVTRVALGTSVGRGIAVFGVSIVTVAAPPPGLRRNRFDNALPCWAIAAIGHNKRLTIKNHLLRLYIFHLLLRLAEMIHTLAQGKYSYLRASTTILSSLTQ